MTFDLRRTLTVTGEAGNKINRALKNEPLKNVKSTSFPRPFAQYDETSWAEVVVRRDQGIAENETLGMGILRKGP